jgi:hypothetical protein
MNLEPYIEKALKELQQKSLQDIQVETALTWAGRACAAADLNRFTDASEYAHEAIEHAALSGNNKLLKAVRDALDSYGVGY